MDEQLREKLVGLAEKETRNDRIKHGDDPSGFYCGNEDYEYGVEDGETNLARDILKMMSEDLPAVKP